MKPSKWIYLFLLPGLLLYGVFFVYPSLSALFYSFTDWDGLSPDFNLIGFENYTRMITDDTVFQTSLVNNLKFMAVVVVLQTGFSLLFALLLLKNTRTNRFFRSLFFFPTVLSSISVAFIGAFLYDPTLGLLNNLFDRVGLGFLSQNWIGDPKIAIYSVALMQVWAHTGQMLVLFLAGLNSIPREMFEAAAVEGASRWQTFRYVTWPLLAPATTIVIAYTTIQSFKAFDLIYAMTRGGPNYATEILSTFLYHSAFQNYEFGYASAGSVLFMLVIALVTFLQFRALRSRKVTY